MGTKPNLAELAETAGSGRTVVAPPERKTHRPKPAPKSVAKDEETPEEKEVPISGLFPEEVRKQFKIMGIQNGKTMQNQLAEAINDCFAKYGQAEIAPTKNGK